MTPEQPAAAKRKGRKKTAGDIEVSESPGATADRLAEGKSTVRYRGKTGTVTGRGSGSRVQVKFEDGEELGVPAKSLEEVGAEQPAAADNDVPAEAMPKEPGFTGVTKDSLGRTYHWVDGKRVPGPQDDAPAANKTTEADEASAPATPTVTDDELEATGGESPAGGLPAPEAGGGDAATAVAAAKPAHLALADTLTEKIKAGERIDAKALFRHADEAHGGTRAEGKYGPSDAYDSLEHAFNRVLERATDPTADLAGAQEQARQIEERLAALPTQTNRSGNKDAFQQFSTPPHYAFAVAWLANLQPGEHVLEPSAGTGSLAIHAQNAGATVHLNELDSKRADHLKQLFGPDRVHKENAEQIAGILPKKGVPAPTAVIMNPPFSQTAGRLGDKKELMTGGRHIGEALRLLAPGGRLVAIVAGGTARTGGTGAGMSPDSPYYKKWFDKLKDHYHLAANVGVADDEYKKYGTSFGTRLLVIDKTGPHGDRETVTGEATDIPDLMAKLEGVRNARRHSEAAEQPPVGPAGGGIPGPDGGASGPQPVTPAAPGAGLLGGPALGAGRDAGGSPATGPRDGDEGAVSGGEPAGARLRAADGGPGARPGTADAGGAPEQPAAGPASGKVRPPRGKSAGGKPVPQPATFVSQLRPAQPVEIHTAAQAPAEPKTTPAGTSSPADEPPALSESLYEQYRPSQLRVPGARPHPTALVESAAMAAVTAPPPRYRPHLSPDVVEKGLLTEPALESVVYAGQAHERFLPAGRDKDGQELPPARRGYFIGDGTGAGKGRQIAGIIADNWNQGRKKHVWVSLKATLHEDAVRDWRDIGMDPAHVVPFDKIRDNPNAPQEGIAFITYDTLKSGSKDPTKANNLDQLVKWLGPDFDGCIAFDEAHAMGNAIQQQGSRGLKDASQRALKGVELQNRLPKARVTYVSATGATEVSNLAYAERLGLWGRETPFATKQEFINEMEHGGVAAMEAVAQSLKATGGYTARSLSFDDGTEKGRVTYDRLTHSLTPEQHAVYDSLADGWQNVLQHIDKALEAAGAIDEKGKVVSRNAKSAALSQFWGAQQRFFNQVMTSMQTPSVINAMEKDIAEGRAPVVQLVNTMEAATKRARAKMGEDDDLEGMDVSPREVLMQYLEKSFPVHRWEKYVDEHGNESSRLVKDAAGNPVEDPQAVALRDELMDMVGSLRIPESPLDMIVNHFGHEQVAECTGRSDRLIYKTQDDGTRKKVMDRRPTSANITEAAAFQGGKKKVLVFSDAGGTGRSYHADKNAQNQAQRVHYMLQPGWRADNAVQGLGRTHRTNQAQAPTYRLVEIEQLKAQKRFISTIARRLDQLGALTRGQRQAGSSGLFKAADNLESPEAHEALRTFFRDLEHGRIQGLSHDEVMKQLGFKKDKDDEKRGRGQDKERDVPMAQFLNRLLSLRVNTQAAVFDAFDERLRQTVERAAREGTLDTGVENYQADRIDRAGEQTVYQDKETGAEARLLSTTVRQKAEKTAFTDTAKKPPLGYYRNERSGRIWAAYPAADRTVAKTGQVIAQYKLVGPSSVRFIPAWEIHQMEQLDGDQAKELWDAEHKESPDFNETEEHFLTGAFLPIWDKIPGGDKPKIFRVRTSDGKTTVGRHIPARLVETLAKNLGLHHASKEHAAADVHPRLASGRATATLANGWTLKPVRVQGERRIELIGPTAYQIGEVTQDGVIKERVNYTTRFFVPTGDEGAKVLERITKARPITEVNTDL